MKDIGTRVFFVGFFFIIVFFTFACELVVNPANANTVETPLYEEISDFGMLDPIFHKQNDTVYVINFWATTCPPCLKEMPHFEQLKKENEDEKLSVLMINVDQKRDLEKRLVPFLKRKQFKLEVIALTDPNATKWTERVNPEWWGALPYTVIYKSNERKDFFQSFESYESLSSEVSSLMGF